MKVLAHTSFIGNTGYANHARSFFCALNKIHEVKVRSSTVGETWNGYNDNPHDNEPYITDEMKEMLILQLLNNPDGTKSNYPIYGYQGSFEPDVNIILADVHNSLFYDEYKGHTIAFNVWESTRYPEDFFETLKKFDEVWVPTQWQYDSLIEQGYPKDKVSIVTEGVDVNVFKPLKPEELIPKDKYQFLLFGRWERRKSTTEIIKTFGETFKDDTEVEMICSVENPYPFDGLKTTEERIERDNINYSNVKFIKFPPREDYINYLKNGDVFVSCARSEGWNLPLIEAMACGTPSIYSNWGGQLQFAKGKGVPVKIKGLVDANIKDSNVGGQYCEPDFDDLRDKMLFVYRNYSEQKIKALEDAELIREEFSWEKVVENADKILTRKDVKSPFVFVTTGNLPYMPVIEKLVQSILEFSDAKILVYGVDCDVPFHYPNVIRRRINPPKRSKHDKWYWKQYACIESIDENFEKFIWIDGDAVINYNFDTIQKHFKDVENYPLPDIHVQDEFFGSYTHDGNDYTQLFNEKLCELWGIHKLPSPIAHICLYLYNKECKWWFEEIIKAYNNLPLEEYTKYYLWNDEGIDNALRCKYEYTKHLPVSNFDTSSYDGDEGNTNQTLHQFYKFWNEDGPQNFNRIYGYQFIPKDKSDITWFHGNKDTEISQKMIDFIKLQRDKNFHKSYSFYTDVYKLESFDSIFGIEGGTYDVAMKYGWPCAIFHEIYNLKDYYQGRKKAISNGDVVVDVGANIGVFTRWAYMEGASKVISFEPDKRYFKLLKLNSDPRTILFNAAVSDSVGEIRIHESPHLGGTTIFPISDEINGYNVRTYTLDYLFEVGLVDKIDFLKVDIEGAEIKAFDGISDENLNKVGVIAMEYHHAHLKYDEELRTRFIERLNKLGFNSFIQFLGVNNALQMIYFSK